jgi:hypothetical protein
MVISTVGQLRQLIADLDDDMPLRTMDDEIPVIFVCDYDDIPEGHNKPPPTLVIEP